MAMAWYCGIDIGSVYSKGVLVRDAELFAFHVMLSGANHRATAEAVRVLREQWEKEDTRELFLIQQLPDILDKVTKVVADNLSIDKVTIVDSGDGRGMPAYVKGVTGSIVAIFEQIKNATGLDIPEILRTRAKPS